MTLTLTMDTTLSRVRIAVDGLGDAATAVVERSTNGVTWTAVRGGLAVPVSAGEARLDDYEFTPGVANTYRVRYAATATYVGAGAAAHAANDTVTPDLPAGIQEGDTLLLLAATRASAQGAPTPPPTGYTEIVTGTGNVRFSASTWDGVAGAPTISITGAGAAGMSVSAQLCAFRGLRSVEELAGAIAAQLNASAQDIATPAITPSADHSVVLWAGWRQDDWTSVAPPAAADAEIGEPDTELGDDQGIAWAYKIQTAAAAVAAAAFTVTGGGAASSRGVVVELLADELTQSDSITPTLDTVWLKNLSRSFLSREITVVDWSDIELPARGGLFPIIGRSRAIGVTDVRTARSYDLTVRCATADEAYDLADCLAGGDPTFLHVPTGCPFPGGYWVVGDVRISRRSQRATSRYVVLPLTEVAAPGPDIVPATATYQTVLDTYATYADLLAAHATYYEVLDLIGQPGEVIVP